MGKLNKVQKAWSDKVGREIAFELRELEAFDGRVQTQLINPETGSIVVAVNAAGEEARTILVERAGEPFIDAGFTELDLEGPNQGNQVNKADIDVPVPSTRPGGALEAKKSKNADEILGSDPVEEDEKLSLKERLTGRKDKGEQ